MCVSSWRRRNRTVNLPLLYPKHFSSKCLKHMGAPTESRLVLLKTHWSHLWEKAVQPNLYRSSLSSSAKGHSQSCLSFPSGLHTELRRSGSWLMGSILARLEASIHREINHSHKHSAHVRPGVEQQVSYLEVSSWNGSCLATRSCFLPNSSSQSFGLFTFDPQTLSHPGSQNVLVLQTL